ncbi:MAG: GtrA family protein [Oxalobacteraceae bacterium]
MSAFVDLLEVRSIRFILIGGINTAFSYCLYAVFLFLGMNYVFSNLFALIIGIFFSFRMQGKFVFRNTAKRLLGRFILVWIIIYFANIFLIRELIQWGLDAYASGALAIIPIVILSYFFQRFFVFRQAVST